MRELTIHKIDCFETEDSGGEDELRMEVLADHKHTKSLRRDMKEGSVWRMNATVLFKDRVVVKLIDEDSPDADDFLGSITIGQTLRRHHTRRFQEDGALYKIDYSVADVSDNAEPHRAAIQKFRQSSKAGIWPQINNKTRLIKDIQRSLSNPFSINQERTFLCGPAVVAFELAQKKRQTYVELCQGLYENGRFAARTQEIHVRRSTIQSRIPRGYRLDHWLITASLRDAENDLFPVTGSSVLATHQDIMKHFQSGFTSLTFPTELMGWSRELLGFREGEFVSCMTSGEMDAFRQAARTIDHQGVAFLLVDSAMVGNPEAGFPDHWIALAGNYHATNQQISFDCYTFGRKERVFLPVHQFEEYLYGVVIGRSSV